MVTMACCKFYMIITIAAVFVIPSIFAREIVVGDTSGWTLNFDYQNWADGKEFYVGDTLVFKYAAGKHNVLRVNETGFQQCDAPSGTMALEKGNDVITLSSPGKKWYICSIPNHCEPGNMKLAITVLPQSGSPASAPLQPPFSAASGGYESLHRLRIFGIACFVRILMI